MKRYYAAALAALMLISLSACERIDDNTRSMPAPEISESSEAAEQLAELNGAAKTAYNAAAEIFADRETMGFNTEQTFSDGIFALSHSSDGMETGFDKSPEAEGDKLINDAVSENHDGRISVYVGATEINGFEHIFVQTRDLDSQKGIGQYPDAVKLSELDSVTWTEFHIRGNGENENAEAPADGNDTSVNDIETVNYAAKEAYNLVSEMIADGECRGYGMKQTFESGTFALANGDGFAPALDSQPEAEGDRNLNDLLAGSYDDIEVYVGITEFEGEECAFAQVRDVNDGAVTGQYPAPPSEAGRITWKTFTQ